MARSEYMKGLIQAEQISKQFNSELVIEKIKYYRSKNENHLGDLLVPSYLQGMYDYIKNQKTRGQKK